MQYYVELKLDHTQTEARACNTANSILGTWGHLLARSHVLESEAVRPTESAVGVRIEVLKSLFRSWDSGSRAPAS